MNDLVAIENKILIIRGQQVLLDRDLAEIYGYSTKAFNQQVKNNLAKFPEDMMLLLSKEEKEYCLRSKILTSNGRGGDRYNPLAFTEQGIYMLMTVLKGELATKQSIALVRLFKKMRNYFAENAGVISRLSSAETKLLEHDQKFDTVFSIIDKYKIEDKQGIFFKGQIYDAYSFFQGLIQKAQNEIVLIDNYIDLTVLDRLSKKNLGVSVVIYTLKNTPVKQIDITKFNTQYSSLTIKYTSAMHDRFLILDNTVIYHIGASIKDLGKKCFAFEQMEDGKNMIKDILQCL